MFTLRVDKVIRHNERYSTIFFEKELKSFPGQFVMLNIFDLEEIPLSLSSPQSVTVKAVGETTRYLIKIKPGERVGIKGPIGNPFSPAKGKVLMIAGGIGVAPLAYLYDFLQKCRVKVKVLYAVRSSDDLVLKERFEKARMRIITEDGSEGEKGNIFDLVYSEDVEEYDKIYICGPEVVMRGIHSYFKELGILNKTEFSLDRYMKCGIGICGSCVIGNGMRVCVEGPVFRGDEIVW